MAQQTVGRRTDGREGLEPALKRRHMTMIAPGGIVGAGLFAGTGPILGQAGPATVVTYLLTGAILILIMRMLGGLHIRMWLYPWLGVILAAYLACSAPGPPQRNTSEMVMQYTPSRED